MTLLPESVKQALRQFIHGRRRAYIATFCNPVGEEVLRDLAKFCRAHESTFHTNAAVSDRLDGRREVFLRIQHYLQLTDDQLWRLYGPTERGQ